MYVLTVKMQPKMFCSPELHRVPRHVFSHFYLFLQEVVISLAKCVHQGTTVPRDSGACCDKYEQTEVHNEKHNWDT